MPSALYSAGVARRSLGLMHVALDHLGVEAVADQVRADRGEHEPDGVDRFAADDRQHEPGHAAQQRDGRPDRDLGRRPFAVFRFADRTHPRRGRQGPGSGVSTVRPSSAVLCACAIRHCAHVSSLRNPTGQIHSVRSAPWHPTNGGEHGDGFAPGGAAARRAVGGALNGQAPGGSLGGRRAPWRLGGRAGRAAPCGPRRGPASAPRLRSGRSRESSTSSQAVSAGRWLAAASRRDLVYSCSARMDTARWAWMMAATSTPGSVRRGRA